jgi:hypothetical protein
LLVGFIWNRTLHHENERVRLSFRRAMEMSHKVFPDVGGEKSIMKIHLGNPGEGTQDDVLDTGLGGSRHGNGVPVATQARGDP